MRALVLGTFATAIAVGAAPSTGAAPRVRVTIQVHPLVAGAMVDALSLQGEVIGAPPRGEVVIEERPCGSSAWRTLRFEWADHAGRWHTSHTASANTSLRARAGSAVSRVVSVDVRPYVSLQPLAPPYFAVRVAASRFLDDRRIVLERAQGQAWRAVVTAPLRRDFARGLAYSTARLRARLRPGTRVRARLGAGRCHVTSTSRVELVPPS